MNEAPVVNSNPVLLFNADFYGTLAAVRCFGRLGIPVTVAESQVFAPARWSRYVTRRVRGPDIRNPDAVLNWLLEFGRQHPGHFLYPTSDEMAWLLAEHRDILSSASFKLYSPPVDCIYRLLNKRLLHSICQTLEIATPETYFPQSEADLKELAENLRYPVMIKPQTQLFFETRTKGGLIHTPAELAQRLLTFMQQNKYKNAFLKQDPSIQWPMLQRYYPEAAHRIYNFSGFIDESGDLFAVRASRKILQRPKRFGVGLCFQTDEVHELLRENLVRLCEHTGYYGAFEVEFIQTDQEGQYLLTDFNPRFYHEMAFDIARGLPLPAFVYYAARGDLDMIRSAVCQSSGHEAGDAKVYCHKQLFWMMLATNRVLARSRAHEIREWKQWYTLHKAMMVDPVFDPKDPLPIVGDSLNILDNLRRHPRSFVRSLLLNR